jgi:uncharacterized membrane protein YoaT (DUF817 family)
MTKKKHTRKGISLGEMVPIALAFVLIGVMLGIGSYINSQIQTVGGFAAGTYPYVAVQNATVALATMAQWLQIIAVVIAAGIVIGVLVHSFVGRKEGI